MKKRLYFIALLSILSLNFATSPLFAVTTISGDETPTFTSVENSQEEAVHGPQPNPEINNNNNNQIDDENQVDLNGEDQFTEEEKKAFVEFNNKIDYYSINKLLTGKCAIKLVENKSYRYKAKKGQESLLETLLYLIENKIETKLIFSSANIIDDGLIEATYTIISEGHLLEEVLLINVIYHYPTFSTAKCVFNSSIDRLLSKDYAEGSKHGEYIYSLKNNIDRQLIELLNKNNMNFRLVHYKLDGFEFGDGVYDHRVSYSFPFHYPKGQLYIKEKKFENDISFVAIKK
ncbi:MAG: hypothetical protein Q8S31_07405 [Alphaproteobacteria bacterium]|nr:hypothetical protein [Alphaproteobacteria bacterium]